jgi:hypothetical protein
LLRHSTRENVEFCDDDELGYAQARTSFASGQGLALDPAYRLAHLPLVAPQHPGVIPAREGTFYDLGLHPRVFSLVLPIPWKALRVAAPFKQLEHELRESPFAPKIAWSLMERRKERLHATICGSLAIGERAPIITESQRRELANFGPVHVELRGLFSGNVNVGRLYLRVYPERRGSENLFGKVQHVLGRPYSNLYLVGLYNLTDDLSPAEASALAALIDRWWSRQIVRLEVTHLWLLWAMDDLVLDAGVAEKVSLTGSFAGHSTDRQRMEP